MPELLARYRAVDYALPKSYLSWDLFGAGLENLGRNGRPVELPLREPNADEVLLRVDALGLCFSDVKLISAGADQVRPLSSLRTALNTEVVTRWLCVSGTVVAMTSAFWRNMQAGRFFWPKVRTRPMRCWSRPP